MTSENFLLLVRLGFSLSLVFGLMWVAARVLKGRAGALSRAKLDHLEVLERKSLGKNSSIAIVRVGDETLTVGITDSTVTLLGHAEIELTDLAAAADGPVDVTEVPSLTVVSNPMPAPNSTVALPATIERKRSILDALRDKTVRHIAG